MNYASLHVDMWLLIYDLRQYVKKYLFFKNRRFLYNDSMGLLQVACRLPTVRRWSKVNYSK
jgi:hypothetical protein